MNRRVVITGMGAITPIGNNVKTYWGHLLKGVSGARRITRFNTESFKTQFACEVKDYNPLNFFDRKEARKLDRFNQFGLIAAQEAIEDAQIPFDQMDNQRMGVLFSSGIGGFETFQHETFDFFNRNQQPRFNPFFITKIIANGIAGHLSIKYGLHGVNSCTVTACASSTNGLIQAFNYIRWNKADLIVTGGSEASITATAIGGFNAMKALSVNNAEMQTASRPFDESRDGFVIGEGAGALVVESLASAQRRGAPIYAEVVGGGETSDAYHITGTHPEGLGAYLAMREAVTEANIDPQVIGYINAHATSTGIGDLSEIKAIDRLFEGQFPSLHVSATKSMTGHLLGGTGAIEAIATAMALKTGTLPPTINTKKVDESIPSELNLTLGTAVKKDLNYALSNSFGFGGHCAAVLLKKFEG